MESNFDRMDVLTKTLIEICKRYGKIITSLDTVLDMATTLTDDEDLIDTVKAVRQNNVKVFKEIQALIDTITTQYQLELLSEIDDIIH